jgi:hypothetical protein
MNPFTTSRIARHILISLASNVLLTHPAYSADPIDHLNVQEPERPGYLSKQPATGFQLPSVPNPQGEAAISAGETFLVNRIVFRWMAQ